MSDKAADATAKRVARKGVKAKSNTTMGKTTTSPVASVEAVEVPARPADEATARSLAKAPAKAVKRVKATVDAIKPAVDVLAPAMVEPVVAAIEAASAAPQFAEFIEAAMSPASVSDMFQAEPEMLATTARGNRKMATVTTENTAFASDKLQSLFGDVGARFKAGFEKSTKMSEEMVDLAKGNVEAVVASARVAAKGSETLGQDAAAYSKKSFEGAVAAMKGFASVKSPTELFQLQSDFAKASFDSAVAEASKFSESMMKLAGEVAQPLSSRYAVAAEKIKAVAL